MLRYLKKPDTQGGTNLTAFQYLLDRSCLGRIKKPLCDSDLSFMTGELFPGVPRLHTRAPAASPSYSIDSYAEYSSKPLARSYVFTQPGSGVASASINHIDEELFRELFSADSGPSTGGNRRGQGDLARGGQKLKAAPRTDTQGPVWATGATLSMPFPTGTGPENLMDLRLAPPRTHEHGIGYQWRGRELGQLIEGGEDKGYTTENEGVEEEVFDNDERLETVTRQSKVTSCTRRSEPPGFPASPGLALKPLSARCIPSEPLSFLERLDLKSLMCTPRPDVTNFLPASMPAAIANTGNAHHNTDTTAHDNDTSTGQGHGNGVFVGSLLSRGKAVNLMPQHSDPRCEEDHPGMHHQCPERTNMKSARGTRIEEVCSRLAHMELMYGTTMGEPRKARRQTFDRLSNPITGRSSTLEALPLEQRKQRGDDTGYVAIQAGNAASCTEYREIPGRVARTPKSHVTLSTHGGYSRNNNQEESASSTTVRPLKPRQQIKGVDARKAELRQKLAKRHLRVETHPESEARCPTTNYDGVGCGNGTTFLTQLDESDTCTTQRSQPVVTSARPMRRLDRAVAADGTAHIRQRPGIPPSIIKRRVAAGTSTSPAPTSRVRTSRIVQPSISKTCIVPDPKSAQKNTPHRPSRTRLSDGARTPAATSGAAPSTRQGVKKARQASTASASTMLLMGPPSKVSRSIRSHPTKKLEDRPLESSKARPSRIRAASSRINSSATRSGGSLGNASATESTDLAVKGVVPQLRKASSRVAPGSTRKVQRKAI